MSWAKASRLSASVLYIDIKASFYSILPEIVLGCLLPERLRFQVLHRAGVPQATKDLIDKIVTNGSHEFALLQMEQPWADLAAQWQVASWYEIKNDPCYYRILSGTHHGDPLNDCVFNDAFAAVLRRIQGGVDILGLGLNIQLQQFSLLPSDQAPQHETPVLTPAFLDDVCIPIVCSATALLDNLASVVAVVQEATAAHGLELNLSEQKTEALCFVGGAGAASGREK